METNEKQAMIESLECIKDEMLQFLLIEKSDLINRQKAYKKRKLTCDNICRQIELIKENSLSKEVSVCHIPHLYIVIETISNHFGIEPSKVICFQSREQGITNCRHIIRYVAWRLFAGNIKEPPVFENKRVSLSKIGKYTGNRDHASVLCSVDKTKFDMKQYAKINNDVNMLYEKCCTLIINNL